MEKWRQSSHSSFTILTYNIYIHWKLSRNDANFIITGGTSGCPALMHLVMKTWASWQLSDFNSLRLRQNGCHFANDTFKHICLNENVRTSVKISHKFVSKGPISNIPALVQIMTWRRPGNKPLSEPMLVRLPTHIYVTQPQWVNATHCTTLHGHHQNNHCGTREIIRYRYLILNDLSSYKWKQMENFCFNQIIWGGTAVLN